MGLGGKAQLRHHRKTWFHLKLLEGSIRWTHHSAFHWSNGHESVPHPQPSAQSSLSPPCLFSNSGLCLPKPPHPQMAAGTRGFCVHPPSGLFSPCPHMISSYFPIFNLFERKKQSLPHPAYFYFSIVIRSQDKMSSFQRVPDLW